MMRKCYGMVTVCIFLFINVAIGEGRANDYFRSPVDIPIYLSGNFGELRSDHYHSGLDIKTQGVEGKKIYATAKGVVSRIKISPFGYGKALYISHPNGYTTVYAHLKEFVPKIDSLVREWQYQRESFEIDTLLIMSGISVYKGELIALSGNSGSSGGPHLHYEIRKTDTECPVNPLLWGVKVKDNKAPVIRKLYVYPLDYNATVNGGRERLELPVSYHKGRYLLQNPSSIKLRGKIGFAVDARDYMSFTKNYYGIYDFKLEVDDTIKHHFTFDTISFEDGRFFNAHIDYDLFKKKRVRIHKGFHEFNHQETFVELISNGIVFDDNDLHEIRIQVSDVVGNTARLNFKAQAQVLKEKSKAVNYPEFLFYAPNRKVDGRLLIDIPSFALFTNYEKVTIDSVVSSKLEAYSPEYSVREQTIPLCKAIKVGITPRYADTYLKSKMFVAQKKRGKYKYIGREWKDNVLIGLTKKIGTFVVLVDTVPPSIQQIKKSVKSPMVKFRIKDKLSGIASYRATVNGKWQAFEYDAKRDLYSFDLSLARGIEKQPYVVEITVVDNCGNRAVKEIVI